VGIIKLPLPNHLRINDVPRLIPSHPLARFIPTRLISLCMRT
jgi:hypothetical protein